MKACSGGFSLLELRRRRFRKLEVPPMAARVRLALIVQNAETTRTTCLRSAAT